MPQNFIRIFMDSAFAFVSIDNDIIVGRSHLSNRIELITPLALGTNDVMQIYFELANGQVTPKRNMAFKTTELVGNEEQFVYRYDIPQSVLSAVTSANATTLLVQFRQSKIDEIQGEPIVTTQKTSAQVTLTLDAAFVAEADEDSIILDQSDFDLLAGRIDDKLLRDFGTYSEKTLLDADDFLAIDEGAGTNKRIKVGSIAQFAISTVNQLIQRLETVENFVDQDVSIGSNPHFATPTVDALTFRDNGNTETIDFADAQAVNLTAGHIADTTIHFVASDVTAADVDLGNVDNTSDADKPVSTATQSALDDKANVSHTHTVGDITDLTDEFYDKLEVDGFLGDKVDTSALGVTVATLNGQGKVPASQLPAFVDDLEEYASLANFPPTGDDDKIYVALDTNKIYRWSGSQYVEVAANEVNSVNSKTGNITLVAGDIGVNATGFDGYLTTAQDDLQKVATKLSTLSATDLNLGNVTNESKATMFTDPTFTGTVSGITATMVGLGNVTDEAQVTDVTATAPIESTGGTTPVISIVPATDEVAGSMSATDKAKLDALDASTLDSDTTNFDGILSTDEDTVQKALDVLDDIDASNIPFDNDGLNLAATDVQGALAEVDLLVEEGLTQVVITRFTIIQADDGSGGFEYQIDGESPVTGAKDGPRFVFDLPTNIEYLTGANRLQVKIDGDDGALKRLFFGPDEELSEISDSSFGIDFALSDDDVLYAKIYQSLATVSIDIGDGTVTESKLANGAVTTAKIGNNAVELSKVQQIPTNTILGNDTVNTTNVKTLTVAETKTLLELDQVDNTSDMNKPISSNTQTALDLKADKTNVLELDNTTSFTPDADFQPATKKYVDDEVAGVAISSIDDIGDVNITGVTDGQVLVYDEVSGDWLPGTNGEVNVIEAVEAEGTLLAISDKTVNVTRASLGAALTDTFTSTILAADTWTDTSGIFTLSKTGGTLTGLLSSDNPIADLELSTIADPITNVPLIQAAWSLIYRIEITNDSVEYYATAEPVFPEDTDIQFKVVR